MEWAKPAHSKSQVDRAGKVLVRRIDDLTNYEQSLLIINNWRASHYYPLNTFKVTLRKKSLDVDSNRLVAQRIKRLSSIEAKLLRFKTMQLSQMQDIGGCRAIVSTTKQVRSLVEKYEKSDLKHTLDDIDDYISSPKISGYRSVHLLYKYKSDKKAPSIYNGLFIEVQIRSRLQHAWATAVETVGTFLRQALKSSQGEEDWLRFFALMGSSLALREGSSALVPNTPSNRTELIRDLRKLASKLNVATSLQMYGHALKVGREGVDKGHHFYLMKLEPSNASMTITGFPRSSLEQATKRYLEVEREISGNAGSEAGRLGS
jgi:ppGpp synthetase/RelA/SpoT-type nucleotidyltranferase